MAIDKNRQTWIICLVAAAVLALAAVVISIVMNKRYEEIAAAKRTTDQQLEDVKKERDRFKKQLADLKKVGGWGDDDQVTDILAKLEEHKQVYANTYGDTTMDVYPKMLELQIDRYFAVQSKLQEEIRRVKDLQSKLAAAEDAQKASDEQHREAVKELETQLNEKATALSSAQQTKERIERELDEKIDNMQRAHTRALETKDNKIEQMAGIQRRTEDQLEATIKVVSDYFQEPLDFTAPDGKIIQASASVGVVYINRGSADGLRRQTRFLVFDHDALLRDAATLEPKGEIEITEVSGPHRAVARVISDTVANPILPGDLIHSFIYRPDMPERFALVGTMNVHGDTTDGLDRLRSMIQINGGRLDAHMASDGTIVGTINERTRYLVLGPIPRGDNENEARENYQKMLDQAAKYGVRRITLEQFLDYIGLQAEDQRYDLSHQVRDRDTSERTESNKGQTFRRRPARGEDGAFE
ncbi:MAG: hypothetical protein DWQ31_18995 [Planctomycetota bacterium]|nr:MAG: hypothetical protein DWQ31_18995 [Planctomycetota bacterium]REJ93174.1 MAG: hypothetical protein DWQ35_10880 [Planctomycetota bacterium]REK23359.1 MAG: hypothetical protein DWQ42_15465 [Planctomycetota bacterium]REK47162.1 MAG: hypothetical protein DWQ46_04845 [Planctomycetota bacterium]